MLESVIKDDNDGTHITLIYQNRFEKDILLRNELDKLALGYPTKFKVHTFIFSFFLLIKNICIQS